MIFDAAACCALAETRQPQGAEPFLLDGSGLWAGVLADGRCALESPALPGPVPGREGELLLGGGPLTLRPVLPCRFVLVRLTGAAANAFLQGLGAPRFARGTLAPGAAEEMERLADLPDLPPAENSRRAYALLCTLAGADEPARALPPLVAEALAAIQENYMALYGIEELSETLGVSKCHLVRTFSAAMGLPPGKYLAHVRVEAVKALLLAGERSLQAIAALCGFSGPDYLCRAFKRETGLSPLAWRAAHAAMPVPALPLPPDQDSVYV